MNHESLFFCRKIMGYHFERIHTNETRSRDLWNDYWTSFITTYTVWFCHQKTVYSPVSGYVYDTYYRLGEKVAANQPVLSLLTAQNIKVLFYIPEEQLSTIHLNQVISFRCDSCKSSTKAIISYILPEAEYTPPIIYSQDTRYKLVYLVRADLPDNMAFKFHPGQPLDVYLNEP